MHVFPKSRVAADPDATGPVECDTAQVELVDCALWDWVLGSLVSEVATEL